MHAGDMKHFSLFIIAAVGMFASTSCERHEWKNSEGKEDGTETLYKPHEKKSYEGEESH